jgi:hypothetical protein
VADNESRENRPIHVTPRGDGWAVVRKGNKMVSTMHPIRHQAEEHGRSLAHQSRTDFVLYDRDGSVLVHDSYGTPHGSEGEGVRGETKGQVTVARPDTGAVQHQVAYHNGARGSWTVEVHTYAAIDESNPGLRDDPMGRAPTESDTYEELSPEYMQRLYPALWEGQTTTPGSRGEWE